MISNSAIAAVAVCGGYVGLCLLSWMYTLATRPGFHVAGRHVFITGGSIGLGLALAKQYARAGAMVTIVARNPERLAAAKREIESSMSSAQKHYPVFTYACDVADFAAVRAAVDDANAFHHRVTDHVICNAGICVPGLVLEQDVEQFRATMETNFFGTLHVVKATLPAMVASPLMDNDPIKHRRFALVNAEGGLASVAGYTNYSSSKYATRGLGEAMRNELKLYGIEVSIFYPGDMDSALLADEQAFKPAVTRKLVMPDRPAPPDAAARALIRGISNGYFAFSNEPILQVLRVISNGVAPRGNTPLEFVVAPIGVLIQTVYLWYFDNIVIKHGREEQKQQRQHS